MFEKIKQKDDSNLFNCLGCGRFVKVSRWYKSYNGWFDILRVSYAKFKVPTKLWRLGNAVKRTVSETQRARGRELALERGFGQKL